MENESSQTNVRLDNSIPGLKIYIYENQAPWNVVIHSQTEQEWSAYCRDSENPMNPMIGTTLLYQKQAWAIRNIAKQADGSLSYFLEPWPEYELWVHQVSVTEEAMTEKVLNEEEKIRMEQLFRISLLIEVCMGWLPADIQNKLSIRWYFYPPEASSRNGVIEAMFGLQMCLFGLYFRCVPMLVSGPYMLGEGVFRMLHCITADKPLGILPTELLYTALRGVYRFFSGFGSR